MAARSAKTEAGPDAPAAPAAAAGRLHLELPWQMLAPLLIVTAAIILLGLGNAYIAGEILAPALSEVTL